MRFKHDPRPRLPRLPAHGPPRARASDRARRPASCAARGSRLPGIGVQIVIISVLPSGTAGLHEAVHMASYVLLGAFAWSNRRVPGVPLIMLGGAAELHRDRRQRRRDARRSRRSRVHVAREAGEGFVNSGAIAEPAPAVPRRRVRDPRRRGRSTTSTASATSRSCSACSCCCTASAARAWCPAAGARRSPAGA